MQKNKYYLDEINKLIEFFESKLGLEKRKPFVGNKSENKEKIKAFEEIIMDLKNLLGDQNKF